jgi:hypothetical protein
MCNFTPLVVCIQLNCHEVIAPILPVIGLPYVPLERMEGAMGVLGKLSMLNAWPRRRFCKEMIKYLRMTWLDGSIPRAAWNMYNHKGVSNNNHGEVDLSFTNV